jgi:hypothetical protein
VLLGAYAMATDNTDFAQVKAVEEFEGRIGRRLDLVHTYAKFNDPFDTMFNVTFQQTGHTLLLSWAGADTRLISGGDYDRAIRAKAQTIKAMKQPVLLEWRWEMDRPNLQPVVSRHPAIARRHDSRLDCAQRYDVALKVSILVRTLLPNEAHSRLFSTRLSTILARLSHFVRIDFVSAGRETMIL